MAFGFFWCVTAFLFRAVGKIYVNRFWALVFLSTCDIFRQNYVCGSSGIVCVFVKFDLCERILYDILCLFFRYNILYLRILQKNIICRSDNATHNFNLSEASKRSYSKHSTELFLFGKN